MEKDINFFYQKIIDSLKGYQFRTFLISIISGKKKNNKIEKPFKIKLGQKLAKKWHKEVDFKDPDILIQISLLNKTVKSQIKPLYFFGRYLKLKPGIPQTKWQIKRFRTSVEEEIGKTLLKITGGIDHSFHGCGREDVDVITIGQGRPFVIEIKNPKKRRINAKKAQKEINKNSSFVKVKKLKITQKKEIKKIKEAKPEKIYQVILASNKIFEKEELINACQKLSGITIKQKTPKRVLKRRANKLRLKKIHYFKLIKFDKINPHLEIKAESGTYIKELISGDDQRTDPSLTKLLNQKVFVKQLIVKKVLF